MVQAMSRTVEILSQQIAEAIKELAQSNKPPVKNN